MEPITNLRHLEFSYGATFQVSHQLDQRRKREELSSGIQPHDGRYQSMLLL